MNGSEANQSSALPKVLGSLPRLQAAVEATAIVAADVPATDPFSLPTGQGTRTKSEDRELKTELILRVRDDLDDGMAVVLGKLPLGAPRRGRRGRQLVTVKLRKAHA